MVERNGQQVRYVIDFYQGARVHPSAGAAPVSVYLDVRPALDSTAAFVDRLTFNLRRQFAPSTLPPACLESSPFFRMMNQGAAATGASTVKALPVPKAAAVTQQEKR